MKLMAIVLLLLFIINATYAHGRKRGNIDTAGYYKKLAINQGEIQLKFIDKTRLWRYDIAAID